MKAEKTLLFPPKNAKFKGYYINLYDLPINEGMKVSAKGPVYPSQEQTCEKVYTHNGGCNI